MLRRKPGISIRTGHWLQTQAGKRRFVSTRAPEETPVQLDVHPSPEPLLLTEPGIQKHIKITMIDTFKKKEGQKAAVWRLQGSSGNISDFLRSRYLAVLGLGPKHR